LAVDGGAHQAKVEAVFPKPLHDNQGLVHGTVEREVKPRKEQVACFVTRSFLTTLKSSDVPPGKRYHCCQNLVTEDLNLGIMYFLTESDTPTVTITKSSVLEPGHPITDF
jgi:hypothetical protein